MGTDKCKVITRGLQLNHQSKLWLRSFSSGVTAGTELLNLRSPEVIDSLPAAPYLEKVGAAQTTALKLLAEDKCQNLY